MGGKITIGKGTYGPFDTCWNSADVAIGNYTSIGAGLKIYLGGNHNSKYVSQFPFFNLYSFEDRREWVTKGDVIIGSDVWIGEDTTIMSGVTIGDGATIAAKSVVAKDIPPFALAAGNPAHVKKYRFPHEVISRLLKLAWWNWEEDKIKRLSKVLNAEMTEEVLKQLEEAI